MKQKELENMDNIELEKPKEVPSILSKRKLLPGDRVLWVIVAMFFAISVVAVYTASSQMGFREGTIDRELQRHLISIGLSVAILFSCYIMGANLFRRFTKLAYIVSWIMTFIAYFTGDGRNNAERWLDIGFFSLQPSELLKIGTIMFLAAQLSARHHRISKVHLLPTTFDVRKWKTPQELDIIMNDIVPIVLPIALSCAVILPAHTSSAIHIFFVSMVLLFIAGIRFKEIMKLLAVAAVVGMMWLAVAGRIGTVIKRVATWAGIELVSEDGKKEEGSKDTYYSQMAIQNGGVFGVGAGRSMMRLKLTHPESDYLFAAIVEEFGLLLSFVIILLYLWLFFRSLRIFEQCEWLYAGLLAVGLALLVTSQGFLHVSVCLGIIPETGQNLPFITRGRTGMFCASIAVGIILSISRQVEQGTLLPPSQRNNMSKHI
ncbi:MAG: FtsW/RodA/SpoVE family cell cycle protein [Alistipes sp.]|nr:FtsW/RodA/SpoVE family cell cycle protein [Alistipes sp.]